MREDFGWEEVDRVRAIVRVCTDGSHLVVARQRSGRVVGWGADVT